MKKKQLTLIMLSVLFVVSLFTHIKVEAKELRARVPELSQIKDQQQLPGKSTFSDVFETPTLRRQPIDYGSDFIDEVKITTESGEPVSSIKNGSIVLAHYAWSVPNNINLFEGDMMTIELPEKLEVTTASTFDVLDGDDVIGKAELNRKQNKMEVIFTDYVEGKTDLQGVISFRVTFEVAKSEEDRYETITITTKGEQQQEIIVHVPGEVESPEKPPVPNDWDIFKGGYRDNDIPNQFYWIVRINGKQETYKNARMEDTIADGHELIESSLVIDKGYWEDDSSFNYNPGRVTQQFIDEGRVDMGPHHLNIDFGDMDKEGYYIWYDTKITDPDSSYHGKAYENKVVFYGDNITSIEDNAYATHLTGSGNGQGTDSLHDVKVVKKDQSSDKLLSQATFSLFSEGKEIKKGLVTDNRGEVLMRDLKVGSYELVETKAPKGYKLDELPIPFEIVKEDGKVTMKKNSAGQMEVIDHTDAREKVLELPMNNHNQPLTVEVRDVLNEPSVIEVFNQRNEWVVQFETNGGSGVDDQRVIDGEKAAKPADPTKDDFEFDDWYTDEALTKSYYFNTPVHEDKILYAKWLDVDSTPRINLRVKNNQLVIFYRNVDELIIEVNDEEYQRLSVNQTLNDDQITIPLRVDSNRTKVMVKGKSEGKTVVTSSLNGSK